ncbi:MAG: PAS domain S-box protein, partial [Deltaproteobacteria bacterium]|nr:PAS domain S-box protein [Deltaproteobacteria bacterium]
MLQEGKGFFTNDPASHPDHIGLPPGHPPLESFLGVPLIYDDRTVGMIGLGNRKDGYTQEELEALLAMTPAIVEAFSRKRSEKALALSRAEFHAIFKSISDAVIFTNTEREIVMVNPAFTARFGYEADAIKGQTTEFLYADRGDYEEQGRKPYHAGGRLAGSTFETTFRRKDGSTFAAESLSTQVKDSQGRTIGLLGVHRDITKRKRAVESLRESEERLRLFIEHAPASLAMFDPEMRYLSVSRRWLNDFNLGERNLIGLSHYEVFPEIPEYWKAVHRRGLLGEVVTAESDRFERSDGSVQYLHWEVRPWRDHAGEVAGIVIFSEDITAREQTHKALQASEERFRLAMEATSDGLWDWNLDTGNIYCSPGYFRMLGYDPGEFPAKPDAWLELIHPDDRARVLAANETCLRNDSPSVHVEFRMRSRDGTWRWILGRGKTVRRDVSGRALQMIGTHVDITDRKEAEDARARVEAQLRQAQKMKALGTLAGGIAHDFNNILGIIIGYSEMARLNADNPFLVRKDLAEVFKGANRAKSLVQQILAFSRQSEQEKRPVQVGLIVKEVLKMLRAS